jgi:hypothetical protein
MSDNMNNIRNHPAFIAYRASNIKMDSPDTQLEDAQKAKQEMKEDLKYSNKGGDKGRA